jgi:hypothetical protein
VEGTISRQLHEEIEDVLQNLLSVYLCNKKDIEREEIESSNYVYSGKLSQKSKMRHQISRDVLRLGSRTVQGIVVTADKLKTRKEISRLTSHVRRVHTAIGRMMAGFSSVRSLQHEWVSTSVEGSSKRDRRHQGKKYSGRSADQEMRRIFDDVGRNGDTPILKELSTTIQEVSRRQ